MNKLSTKALGIVDAQRGFMPVTEGDRLGLAGFGELPVDEGELIVPALNRILISRFRPDFIFTTQDWHPDGTAHISEEPNYDTTWPTHCMANTPGAKLHPLLELPDDIVIYKKGMEKLLQGVDDTSYSGYNSFTLQREFDPRGGWDLNFRQLHESEAWLRFLAGERPETRTVYLGGLALDYCVQATGIDFKIKLGVDVAILTDATRPVDKQAGEKALREMAALGIRIITVDQALAELEEAYRASN
ncbi:isochorismatase family protein [Candidatus Saccharibacteria bacterium]|nr:isochorismatase family protein [Candidatus Saccharibacteria bacterium]MCB9821588.1 isochorismatase family protein [Candidatus Nomurabacteria bacterium]